jgi:hypothetical protein
LEALDIDGQIYKMVLKETKCDGVEWINLSIGTSGKLLLRQS